MQVLAERFQLGESFDQAGRNVLGVRGHEADALDRGFLAKRGGAGRRSPLFRAKPGSAPYAFTFWPSRVTSRTPCSVPARAPRPGCPRRPAKPPGPRTDGHDAVGAVVGAARHDLHPGERALPPRPAEVRRSNRVVCSGEGPGGAAARRGAPRSDGGARAGSAGPTQDVHDGVAPAERTRGRLCARQPATTTRRAGCSRFSRRASPRWPSRRVSAFSRIEQVL